MALASTLSSLSVKICWCVNLDVVKLLVVKGDFIIKFYSKVCPTFVKSLFETHDASCIHNA